MTHLSLFSGIGGIDIAAHWAGFETVAFCERDEFCQKVLARHWPNVPIYDDVRTLDGTTFRGVTLLSAGIPCQPHSLAGKRGASGDERDLWGELVRIVDEARPEWVVVENVPGFLSSECGRFFGRVLNDLAGLGYRVGWGCWSASEVGAVHRRKRVFIVAHSAGVRCVGSTERERGREAEKGRLPELVSGIELKRRSADDLGTGDWRRWDVKPLILREADGVSRRVDAARLKALGNAVCPQQIYPLLKAIAENSR